MEIKEYQKQYYLKNKKRLLEDSKQYYLENKKHRKQYRLNNKTRIAKYKKQYSLENKEKIAEYRKQYYLKNREKHLEKVRLWQLNNPEKTKEIHQKYCQENKEKINEYSNDWQKNRRKIDIKYNLNSKISHSIYKSIRKNKNGYHWENLVEYTVKELKKHLEQTIPKGYTWQDFMEGKLHIDHIIPISVFNFNKPEHIDFKRCWSLKNLRLLPAEENLKKGNKLYKPFQPALKI
jgi:5-methylcytosine-specific restriction endonuclease McrA